MALKALKKKTSARQPARMKYKIEKKVREHKRKIKKAAKKSGAHKKGPKQKMIQVPNICPFKEDIIKEAEAVRQHNDEEKAKRREQARLERLAKPKGQSLESIVVSAQTRGALHTAINESRGPASTDDYMCEERSKENSLKAYFKEFKKVVENADVILEVVDARDPLGTRCAEVERAVKLAPGNKRLVVVLNKADLVPKENLTQWLAYLRRFGPATVFKASTQDQAAKLGRRKYHEMKTNEKAMAGSTCVGAELLMSMLANYCRNKGIKTSIRVGVVGIPNVGKSSLINSLKRGRACTVGSTPGITRSMQEVELDSKIKLLDCPGIVFAKGDAQFALKNAQRVTDVKDPVKVATSILQRASKMYFCKLYDITMFETPEEFFAKKAKRMGKMKRGGTLDVFAAARTVLNDWNSGRIKYFTHPPELAPVETHLSAEIVKVGAGEGALEVKEFDLDALLEMETKMMDGMEDENGENKDASKFITIESTGPVEMQKEGEEEEEAMETDEDDEEGGSSGMMSKLISKRTQIVGADGESDEEVKQPKDNKRFKKAGKKQVDQEMQLEGNHQLNKNSKKLMKKAKKQVQKTEKRLNKVDDILGNLNLKTEGSSSGGGGKAGEDYSFEVDY